MALLIIEFILQGYIVFFSFREIKFLLLVENSGGIRFKICHKSMTNFTGKYSIPKKMGVIEIWSPRRQTSWVNNQSPTSQTE